MKILFVLHADFEKTGIIGSWASVNEFLQTICRAFAGEQILKSDFASINKTMITILDALLMITL